MTLLIGEYQLHAPLVLPYQAQARIHIDGGKQVDDRCNDGHRVGRPAAAGRFESLRCHQQGPGKEQRQYQSPGRQVKKVFDGKGSRCVHQQSHVAVHQRHTQDVHRDQYPGQENVFAGTGMDHHETTEVAYGTGQGRRQQAIGPDIASTPGKQGENNQQSQHDAAE